MNLFRRIQYSQNWNIGFCEQTPKELICGKRLMPVKWMRHPYRDRWFADPFIFHVSDYDITVFVEECLIEHPKGIICELIIDRKTLQLKQRYVLLELDSHLSYPAIIHHEGKVYVYPENGASGRLNIYEYDAENHQLVNPICILDEAVADATILSHNGLYYLSATRFPETQEKAYIYVSYSIFGPYKLMSEMPYQVGLSYSRQGGGFFEAEGCLYRPAQNCEFRYGGALSIMCFNVSNSIFEKPAFGLAPTDSRYSLGLHTINFKDGICVIDGCSFYYPFLGKLYYNSRLRTALTR